MNPNIYIEEKRLLAQIRQRRAEPAVQARAAASLPASDHTVLHHLIGSLGARFITLGARMQRFAQAGE